MIRIEGFQIFHVMSGGGWSLQALKMMDRPINLLVSAWTYHLPNDPFRLKSNRQLIRDKSALLIVDSGFLSAAKKGKTEWANQQDRVIECAEELGADVVSMMDIPMEPTLLRSAGFERNHAPDFTRALETTLRNAEAMRNSKIAVKKIYVNQGWSLEHREECWRGMRSLGLDAESGWWGIGTVAMREPPDLYAHVSWCRKHIDGHLHTFGISKPEWVKEIYGMGVNSCDSSSASQATAFGEWITNGRRVSSTKTAEGRILLNNRMKALMYWYNAEAIEYFAIGVPSRQKAKWTEGPQQGRFAI